MNKKQTKTLEAIFANPISSSIPWSNIESMLLACGAKINEGKGSRIRIVLNDVKAVFHRPHPRKETDKGAVASVRRFLTEAGIMP